MFLSTIGTGIVGAFCIYIIACFLLSAMITGTTFSDDILTFALPIAVAGGAIISIIKFTFTARGTEGRQ